MLPWPKGQTDRRRQPFVCIPISGYTSSCCFRLSRETRQRRVENGKKTNSHAGKQENENKTRNNVRLINRRKPIPRFQCLSWSGQEVNRWKYYKFEFAHILWQLCVFWIYDVFLNFLFALIYFLVFWSTKFSKMYMHFCMSDIRHVFHFFVVWRGKYWMFFPRIKIKHKKYIKYHRL